MEINPEPLPTDYMIDMSGRLRERIKALNIQQTELARRVGISPQRLNNYLNRTGNNPDVDLTAKFARALGVSADWLLGLNEDGPIDYGPIIVRTLELTGMDSDMAATVAEVVLEAGRIASALPDEGDAALRSRVAAQAAWQTRGATRQGK